jgi:hypothetical protein
MKFLLLLLLFSLINVYLNHAYDIPVKEEEEEVMMVLIEKQKNFN